MIKVVKGLIPLGLVGFDISRVCAQNSQLSVEPYLLKLSATSVEVIFETSAPNVGSVSYRPDIGGNQEIVQTPMC